MIMICDLSMISDLSMICNLSMISDPSMICDLSMICDFVFPGWGSKSELRHLNDSQLMKYRISKTLQQIEVPIAPWSKCQDMYSTSHRQFARYNFRVFCGGQMNRTGVYNIGGCIGDSGSPLVCDSDEGSVLHGIMLGGHPLCVTGHSFIIFTNVSRYKNWIKRYAV